MFEVAKHTVLTFTHACMHKRSDKMVDRLSLGSAVIALYQAVSHLRHRACMFCRESEQWMWRAALIPVNAIR